MRQVLAILGDSLREAIDRRSLLVMLIIGLLPIVFCFSLSFEQQPLHEILEPQAAEIGEFHMTRGGNHTSTYHAVAVDADARPVSENDSWCTEVAGGHIVALDFAEPRQPVELADEWLEFHDPNRQGSVNVLPSSAPVTEVEAAKAERFLEERYRHFGFTQVKARAVDTGLGTYEVAVRSDYPHEVQGAHAIHILFGTVTIPSGSISAARFVIEVQNGLAQTFVGFIGMLVALFACSGFVPNLLQKGTLDLALARPIGRAKLLLAKYLGGLWFVFCIGAFTIAGCWLGLTFATGYSNPWFLLTVFTLTGFFGVLYAVSVLVGVWTRSSGLSAMAAVTVWFISSMIVEARHALVGFRMVADLPDWSETLLEVAYGVMPKIKDVDYLNGHIISQAHLSPEMFEALATERLPDVNWWFSLGTTAAFAAIVLWLAVWVFRRRDC